MINKLLFTSADLKSEKHLPPLEWYLAGSRGGICSYSLIDRPLRAYHGLYQVSYNPPAQRQLLLSAILVYANSKLLHPSPFEPENGYSSLQYWRSFEWHSDKAVYYYNIDSTILKKTIFINPHDFNTFIYFEIVHGQPLEIDIYPCLNNRNIDSFEQNLKNLKYSIQEGKRLDVDVPNFSPWHMHFSHGSWHDECSFPVIWYPYECFRDRYFKEKVMVPGHLKTFLSADRPLMLECSLKKKRSQVDKIEERLAIEKKTVWEQGCKFQVPELPYLLHNLKTFLIKRDNLNSWSIIAGYPWFMDWGRDTMIVLRGMMYILKPFQVQKILETFWKSMSQGMIPNCFDAQNADRAYYNTIDATLWLFVVLYEYYQLTSDKLYIEKCLSYLEEIISSHINGTRWNIRVDEDGLLQGGDRQTQLTWMDVKIGKKAVTPRMGKAIEINALWYNALKIFRYFSELCRRDFDYENYITLYEENFLSMFFDAEHYNLADWIYKGETNWQNRPNQLFCLALPFREYLPVTIQKRIFETVTDNLTTPFGLRTLSPKDPGYRGFYGGDIYERDSAYHQGTVWPWLMGTYIDAYVNSTMDCQSVRKKVITQIITPLLNEVRHGNIEGIPEVYSGEWPHEPGGCFSQAWSVSELIRIIFRYLSP